MDKTIIADIRQIMQSARSKAYSAVNSAMLEAYWSIGKRIVTEEQKGAERAEYGKYTLEELAKRLTAELGKGFTEANLRNFRQFYLSFPNLLIRYAVRSELQNADNHNNGKRYAVRSVSETTGNWVAGPLLRHELTWTHYRLIMRITNPGAREYYIREAANNNWSTRVLERNINTFFYERILSSQKKQAALHGATSEKHSPTDFIKDPYIFEFLNIPQPHQMSEHELETALIDNLQKFLLELGKGFCFVNRQLRVHTETKTFPIDLVFYNHILKCFILIDLKTGALTHQDVGQMDMYVRMFDDLERGEHDNPTIGIILCTEKDKTIVKYSVLNGSEQIFATKYRSFLPTEEELKEEIERGRFLLEEKVRSQNN